MRICYLLIIFLLSAQCRHNDKYAYMQLPTQVTGPGSFIREHEHLLKKANILSEGKDSIAVKLYELLDYHFSEEERYVFPPLRVLPELAAGKIPEESDAIIEATMEFKSNLAKLLAEHQMITALLNDYRLQSKKQHDTVFSELERDLAQHAKVEEEIYFPAVVVIGDYLRLKSIVIKH
jgi:hypothetical protein